MARIAGSKRAMAMVAAVVLAAVATVALLSYVRGVEANALQGAEAVDAFVAKEVIPAGTVGRDAISKGLIVKAPVPKRNLVEGAITALDQVQDKVASATILKGEQIAQPRFVAAQEAKTLPIPKGMQAMSVQVGIPPGVAGFIQQNDRISILAQIDTKQGSDGPRVQYLLQNVQVLAVGHRTVVKQDGKDQSQAQQNDNQILLTLALNPVDVEKLTVAVFQGQLYFTLLPPGSEPVRTPGRTVANVFGD